MFKGQPKGLYALALANTGERFGYYTMLAIFTLFLQAKFGLSSTVTSNIFGGFLAFVYFMPLVGGIIADKWLGYGKTVTIGIIVMFLGYALLAVPTSVGTFAYVMMFGALALISIGTGLFKGNLQVMVGNLYDNAKLAGLRDTAFSIFYMAINIGALFAPTAATEITNWFLGKSGLVYDAAIPALSHQVLDGTIAAEGTAIMSNFMASLGDTFANMSINEFAGYYIEKLSTAYNYGFGIACISLIFSMLIFAITRKTYKHADYNAKQLAKQAASENVEKPKELTPKQTRERVVALILVFIVVIFFWMAFHQNGLTMTFFARDYTAKQVMGLDRIGFSVLNLALLIVAVYSAFSIFQSSKAKSKLISAGVFVLSIGCLVWKYSTMPAILDIFPQIFQQFNPFFVVALTPVSLAIFGSLAKKGKDMSAPRKIGIGMVIAALGFLIMSIGSLGLQTPDQLAVAGGVSDRLVSPNWLISTYLVLTFAELLLSPMGISFVSKVAPPKLKGAMMGGWFAATAVGNYLTSVIGMLWGPISLWLLWGILIVCCLLSAIFIFSILKRLEKVTNEA